MTMKIRVKIKNRSQRYDINRPRPRHGHKYIKYKMCLRIMMVYALSKAYTTFEAQSMKKLNKSRRLEAE